MITTLKCFHCDWHGSPIELIVSPTGVKCPMCKKKIPQDADGWINISIQGNPLELGWYDIKTPYGEYEAPFVNNSRGELVWVIPDPSIITHWKYKTK